MRDLRAPRNASREAARRPSGRWYIRRLPGRAAALPTRHQTRRQTSLATEEGFRAPVSDDALSHAWPPIRDELRRAVPDSTWHLWLQPLRPVALPGGELILEASDAIRSWVASNFARLLQAAAASVLGAGAVVRVVAPGSAPAAPKATASAGVQFNPRLPFDQFVIGDSNRLAHAAALAVAELPGLAYNPLFICGPPGLGKTHLLHSIANYVHAHGDGLTARYTTAEAFTDRFVGALHTGAIEAFKAAYRGVDVLLVDDVQFLQSKARTEQ